jgi:hypothetical protein
MKSSRHQDDSSRENCYLRSGMESETLRETQRMGDLAVRPLTFKPYSNSQHKSVNHEDSSSPQGLGALNKNH